MGNSPRRGTSEHNWFEEKYLEGTIHDQKQRVGKVIVGRKPGKKLGLKIRGRTDLVGKRRRLGKIAR